ncbi:MAG TPA: helix-turn-helix domain-containing protein [Egicoccus sp.]|nr:helix-turn-helix domain-containing protein [Egicoccus sp.]HSK21857.1 helix-turn-helix domain-containing protein [Egicoccus sp.]
MPAQTRDPLAIRLLTVAEVAGALRVSTMTVYRLIKSRELPAIRVGKNFRIRQQDLDDYLTAGATVVADPSNG